jgi:hypothetical protein
MMAKRRSAVVAVGAMLILAATFARATEPQVELRRNPFERPAAREFTTNAAIPNSDLTEGGDPGLRGVLVAGTKSVVDFGGVILQIGESTDGYLLIAVEEGKATFRKNGKVIVFSLYEQSGE